ncbi:MAG: biosynthetic-type acetolactate synthase large subunit [Clostridia bacterium]|nr:biosynthetic-type acetolactate synthase large subunit [Clostridia bacterium]MBQ9289652.1 biosynthetic-type acetolactate synthase large subunit [Clostridia bacterium]MBR0215760.1 biosynthetic-type acetolactate synthase large subunit [Clostridia bacterium]
MQLNGARILLECLKEQGVDTIFGYPGGTILNVYDELYKMGDEIHHVLTAHEQGACHAADGYARSTGRVGVCFATSGPGATNLVTGIATAYLDSSPIVAITCNVSTGLIGKDSFQEVDITGVTMPITKCNFLVRSVNNLADTVREAFAIARSGRPGPVLIDIAKDVTAQMGEYTPMARKNHGKSGHLGALMQRYDFKPPEPDGDDIRLLADMLRQSEKPFIICGGGVVRSRAHEIFSAFAHRVDAPVALTVMGAGALSGTDPLVTGMIGMHGSQASNIAVDECDLLLAIGCRFSDRVALKTDTFAQHAKIVQIDIDRSEINKNVQTDHHIVGDAGRVLELLMELVPEMHHDAWKAEVFSHPRETIYDEHPGCLTPGQILGAIVSAAPKDSIVSTDVGQHQMWAIQHFHFDYPGQLLTSGGFGTMGFGLGAAIGAQTAFPNKRVLHITGDGSFRMNCNELSTVQYYGLPIITVIFDNRTLGMVRQWQTLIYGGRFSQTTLDRAPDFVRLAEAYGLNGFRASSLEEFETVFQQALASPRGSVIDCLIDIDEKVRPMVGGGSHITDFMLN